MYAATLLQPLKTKHCGSVHYMKIGDSRLRTVTSAAGLWGGGAEPIIFNSYRRFTFTGCCSAIHGLHAQLVIIMNKRGLSADP